MVQATQTRRESTPERWAKAIDRALDAGLEIFTTPDGERFVSSASQLDVIYRCDGEHCACQAALAGDPVCQHRAVVRFTLGTIPVVVVHVEELEAVRCPSCTGGRVEEWCCGHVSGVAPCGVCGGRGRVPVLPAVQPARVAA